MIDYSALSDEQRGALADQGRNDLYFFAKNILGYDKLTPNCHGMLAAWYQNSPKRFKLIMIPRGHYKSTLFTIAGILWQVVRDPNKTHLIINETGTNASRFLQTIKIICESHAMFRLLYGHLIPRDTRKVRWNNEELTFVRQRYAPEPTVDSLGIDGTGTSRHYDHIILDDIISESAANSHVVMANAIQAMRSIQPLLVDRAHDPIDWIGTHWGLHDVYTWLAKNYGNEMGRVSLPIVNAQGEMLIPNLMTPDALALERKTMGPYLFSCLMMNNPRDEENQDLNIRDLRYWEWLDGNPDSNTVVLHDITGDTLDRWRLDQLDITTTVDLAPSETIKSDRNSIATVGVSPKAQAIVLDSWAKRCKPMEVLDRIFYLHGRFSPRLFGIENVAYQAAFKHFVEQRMLDESKYLRVVPIKAPTVAKSHVRGLQPVMAVGRLYVHAQQHILLNEMAEYPLGEHDDAVDALAMQLQVWRGVLGPEARERAAKAVDELVAEAQRGPIRHRGLRNAPLIHDTLDPDDDIPWKPSRWSSVIIS